MHKPQLRERRRIILQRQDPKVERQHGEDGVWEVAKGQLALLSLVFHAPVLTSDNFFLMRRTTKIYSATVNLFHPCCSIIFTRMLSHKSVLLSFLPTSSKPINPKPSFLKIHRHSVLQPFLILVVSGISTKVLISNLLHHYQLPQRHTM